MIVPCKCKKLHGFSFYLLLSPLKNILNYHKTITGDYSPSPIALPIYVYLGVTILLFDIKTELNVFKGVTVYKNLSVHLKINSKINTFFRYS